MHLTQEILDLGTCAAAHIDAAHEALALLSLKINEVADAKPIDALIDPLIDTLKSLATKTDALRSAIIYTAAHRMR